MAVQVLVFEEQANYEALVASGAVAYQTIGTYTDPANPVPALATNRFFQIAAAQLANDAQGQELNDLMVNNGAFSGLRFVDFEAHEVNGRARLSLYVTSTPPNVSYPTLAQVRIRAWEPIMIPTTPAPATPTNLVSWEQNPLVDPRQRLALTDHLALLTANIVALGIALPGAGTRALIKQKLIRRRGLSMLLTAEFTQTGLIELP